MKPELKKTRSTLKLNKVKAQKRWSHQDDLTFYRSKKIILVHSDNTTTQGVLLDSDQFTLKVKLDISQFKPFKNFKSDAPIIIQKGSLIGYQIGGEK